MTGLPLWVLQGRRKPLMFDYPAGAPSTTLIDFVIVSILSEKSKSSEDFPFCHFEERNWVNTGLSPAGVAYVLNSALY